jgi:hypothetical protein
MLRQLPCPKPGGTIFIAFFFFLCSILTLWQLLLFYLFANNLRGAMGALHSLIHSYDNNEFSFWCPCSKVPKWQRKYMFR